MGPVGGNARLMTQQNTSHHIPFFVKKSIYLPHLGRYFDFFVILLFFLDFLIFS